MLTYLFEMTTATTGVHMESSWYSTSQIKKALIMFGTGCSKFTFGFGFGARLTIQTGKSIAMQQKK